MICRVMARSSVSRSRSSRSTSVWPSRRRVPRRHVGLAAQGGLDLDRGQQPLFDQVLADAGNDRGRFEIGLSGVDMRLQGSAFGQQGDKDQIHPAVRTQADVQGQESPAVRTAQTPSGGRVKNLVRHRIALSAPTGV